MGLICQPHLQPFLLESSVTTVTKRNETVRYILAVLQNPTNSANQLLEPENHLKKGTSS